MRDGYTVGYIALVFVRRRGKFGGPDIWERSLADRGSNK